MKKLKAMTSVEQRKTMETMYIDKYTVKKIGTKWEGNKHKKNQILLKLIVKKV